MSVFIIAEAGVNHNGSYDLACRLALEAKKSGADAVKYQTFKADALVTPDAGMAEYQKQAVGASKSQYQMLKSLELTEEEFISLKHYCDDIGIAFCTTTFDPVSTAFAFGKLDLPFVKIPSGEITNLPFLEAAGASKKPVILSTGACTLSEVQDAVDVLKYAGSTDITVLHCTTQYPAPYEDIDLRAMEAMGKTLGLSYGYSDHTKGIEVAVAAVAMGATVIEKHFTLDKSMEGPDHKASLEPQELTELVTAIRHVERALGNSEKKIHQSEEDNRKIVRKSIVALKPIKQGEIFSEDNIGTKRAGAGISPMRWHEVIGRCASRNYDTNELIEL